MATKKTILIDFDGVLATYDGWKGEGELGEPLENARRACFLLADHFKLICFTTRSRHVVEPWLAANGFTCIVGVTNLKVPAFLQIDDRAVRFNGQWTDELIKEIKEFKPWWEKVKEAIAPTN